MTTLHVNLSDDRAATIAAKAEAQGMTLADWRVGKLAAEAPIRKPHYRLSELMQECDVEAFPSEEDHAWLCSGSAGNGESVLPVRQWRERMKKRQKHDTPEEKVAIRSPRT